MVKMSTPESEDPAVCGNIFLTASAKFTLHGASARMPAAPSSVLPPCLATLRTNQPAAQGIDAPDGLSRGFLVRLVELAGNERLAGHLSESQIPRAGSTAEGADAAHVLRLLAKQTGVSKVHFSNSLRLTFIDRGAPKSPANLDAMRVLIPVAP
jgi:hypothetical protein